MRIMSKSSNSKLATVRTIFTAVGSVVATAMVVRTVAREFVPAEVRDHLYTGLRKLYDRFSNVLTVVVDEFDGLVTNEIYEAAEAYLGPKISPTTRRVKISKPPKEKNFNMAMEKGEELTDVFNGVKLKWAWIVNKVETKSFYNPRDTNSSLRSEVRSYELTFDKKNQDFVINTYFPYILSEAKSRKHDKKTIKIFTTNYEQMHNAWMPVSLDHPATFDTLAMDFETKDMILKDLERFVKRKEYYRKVGKAWKRGYLLYGPPGTGKSSLIAAMANFLNFDIYDLELTEVRRNSVLRKLLVATANKSILVVEDIDCTIEFQERLSNKAAAAAASSSSPGFHREENKVTLSGFLNFIDGLWSSCGDERIIIFTTNHKEKLDPALLRPGRMDVHIHMSYCTPCGFRTLAANYLEIQEHCLFKEIEELIETTEVTPAEVAEQLLRNDEADVALKGLIDFLHVKRKDNEEAKGKKGAVETKNEEGNVVEDEKKDKVIANQEI